MEDPQIELLGARTGNCLRAAIALAESGLPYSATRIDLRGGENRTPEFLALNPSGQLPVLIDRHPSGGALILSQSNAIMLHIAGSGPNRLMPASGEPERTLFFERFFYFVTDVIVLNNAAFLVRTIDDGASATFLAKRSLAHLEAAERFLHPNPYMAGEDFSLVDILAFTVTRSVERDVNWSAFPHLRIWYELIASRPAVVRGLQTFE